MLLLWREGLRFGGGSHRGRPSHRRCRRGPQLTHDVRRDLGKGFIVTYTRAADQERGGGHAREVNAWGCPGILWVIAVLVVQCPYHGL